MSATSTKEDVSLEAPAPTLPVSPSEPAKIQPDLPPEGGTRAWLVVMGAFLSIFCTFGFLNA